MPAPQTPVRQSFPVPTGNGLAELCNLARTCAGVIPGVADSISDTTPETCGADMLVPW